LCCAATRCPSSCVTCVSSQQRQPFGTSGFFFFSVAKKEEKTNNGHIYIGFVVFVLFSLADGITFFFFFRLPPDVFPAVLLLLS
jgi:hypothetical protein